MSSRSRRAQGLCAVVTLVVLAADQAVKAGLIAFLRSHGGAVRITGFFNLVQVWNPGVSFGMLSRLGAPLERWLLVAVAVVLVAGLWIWLARSGRCYLGLAIGLVAGGAFGNALDRVTRGAVADFFDFHWAAWHWPAFNLADSAITVGVALLLIDTLFRRPETSNK